MCDRHKFQFEVDVAIREQVIVKFKASPDHPLDPEVAPPLKGIYGLYWKGQFVYGGKALRTTLKRRLAEHYKKINGRRNIDVKDITCRFLIIDNDWWVRAGEDAIITHFRGTWQGSGFGGHVPGKGRPGVKGLPRWDQMFPKK